MADTKVKDMPAYLQYAQKYKQLVGNLLNDDGVDLWKKEIVIGFINRSTQTVNEGILKVRANCEVKDWEDESHALAIIFGTPTESDAG